MNVWTISNALMVIVWSTAILIAAENDENDGSCGPLKMKMSEYDACYDVKSEAEIPCPEKSRKYKRILRKCRPTHALDRDGGSILNVIYRCTYKGWKLLSEDCQSGRLGTKGKKKKKLTGACGPLKMKMSEYDACYNVKSRAEIPCPEKSERYTRILRKCRPTHALDRNGEPILNVTYYCRGERWTLSSGDCQSDCGRPRPNNKHPWIVAIYNQDEELVSTGTIISPYHVLTDSVYFEVDYSYMNPKLKGVSNFTIVAGKHYTNIHRNKKSAQVRKIKEAIPQQIIPGKISNLLLLAVDSEFEFFEDVQPACIDWDNYYELKDFSEGNEAVAVGWDYVRDETVPCEDTNEHNVQYWQVSTCQQNSADTFFQVLYIRDMFCGAYLNDNHCGQSRGVGILFKSSPWRYYLRGITNTIAREPHVTHVRYITVSSSLDWLEKQMKLHSAFDFPYNTPFRFSTRDVFTPKKKTGCILPEDIKYGRFKLIFGESHRPGAWVPTGTRLLLICTANADETPISIQCNMGEWRPPISKLECRRPGTCPTLLSTASEDIICRLNGQKVSCVQPENNTTAVIRCKPFHVILGNKPIYKCKDGEWDQPPASCTLECGTKRVGVATLIVGGTEVIKNEYPWVVAVYRSGEQKCGGTIISKSYVLSAAHCFTTFNGTMRDKQLYTIIAGKHLRNFNAEEPSAQSRKIKSLHIHADYKGSLQKFRDDIALVELDTELIPTQEVQPVCLDWENLYEDFDFVDGNNAVVAGWGYTKETGDFSEELKKLVLPYRPRDVCMENLPEDFSHQYATTDKICAGDKDNNMNVCEGDSGGGLYFQSDDRRFYVRGIVSLTARTEVGTCHLNTFALYTKVSKYLSWIETITRRML